MQIQQKKIVKSTTAVIEMLLRERKAQEEEIKRLSNVVNEIVNKSDKKMFENEA